MLPSYPNNTTDSMPSICFSLHMSVFFSQLRSEIRLGRYRHYGSSSIWAAFTFAALSQLYAHTGAVYREIKRLFNCNGIGVLLLLSNSRVLGQSDSYMVSSIPEHIFSPKTHCAVSLQSAKHHLDAFTFTHSTETNTLQSQRVKCFAQGPKSSSVNHIINPRARILSSCLYFYLFILFLRAFFRHVQFTDTFPLHQFVLLLFCPLTVSSSLVI